MPPLMRQTGHEDMTMGEGNGDVSVTYELLLISCRMFFVAVTGFVRDVIQFLHHPPSTPTDLRSVGFFIPTPPLGVGIRRLRRCFRRYRQQSNKKVTTTAKTVAQTANLLTWAHKAVFHRG